MEKVRRQKPKRSYSKRAWHDAFIAAYRETGNVSVAARSAGVAPRTAWKAISENDGFKCRCEEAKEEAIDKLEHHALKRATDAQKPSDVLTIFLLKAARPEKYKDCYYNKGGIIEAVQPQQTVNETTVIVLPANGFESPGTVMQEKVIDVQATTEQNTTKELAEKTE